jgi:5'-3' exonuclease
MMGKSLMLLDAASLYFRAFYGVPRSVTAPDGTPVNAVRGMVDMIAFLLDSRRPDRLVACWDDDWRPEFRVRAIPSYKAHRVGVAGAGADDSPPELAVQVPLIVEVLAAVGIARLGAPGYEADDVIGTLVQRNARPGGPAIDVVTGDRDLFQLVDDACRVRVLYTAKGVRDAQRVDQAWLRQRYGVASGDAYADLAVLRGDPSDGLPGVPGIGEKTAAGLLAGHGDLPGLLAAAADPASGLSGAQRRKLADAAGYLAVAPAVVRVARDAQIPGIDGIDDRVPAQPADPEGVLALAERWGLSTSLARLVEALGRGWEG